MKGKVLLAGAVLLAAAAAMAWAGRKGPAPRLATIPASDEFTPEEVERILQQSPLGPPPGDPTNAVADDPGAAILGQAIFYDPRFSRTGKTACVTCHDPKRGLGDGKPMPDAFPVDRNVPTLWNVAYSRWFFWDGRADSLWSQALQPLENPREHGGTRLEVAHILSSDPRLSGLYTRVFGALPALDDSRRYPPAGGPVTEGADGPHRRAWASMAPDDRATIDRIFANVGKCLEAYERRLVSRNAPFDTFVEGLRSGDKAKMAALSPSAKVGLKIFVGKGNCRLCHSGPAFTDGEFHNLGIPPSRGGPTASRFAAIPMAQTDPFNGKGVYSDDRDAGAKKLDYLVHLPDSWGQIKTPGLRNVARTAPYMHQGQFKTLAEVVDFYSMLQGMLQAGHHERTILLPLFLDKAESAGLVAFLECLTDEKIDESLLQPLP
ncbi:MAG TPA: cytochrome c peroxidase [Planctomycetota bacterium]|nr:cytochrome c peroxidase [Planctomycetota bacterium]